MPARESERDLLLVRHTVPQIEPALSARAWHLSEEGRRRCIPFAVGAAGVAYHLARARIWRELSDLQYRSKKPRRSGLMA
jgi:hypothetical protein